MKHTPLTRAFFVVIGTKAWLHGLEDYLQKISALMKVHHPLDAEELKRTAEDSGLPWEDYDSKRQELDSQYLFTFPRILSFSMITLLYTVLERRLTVLADYLRWRDGHALRLVEFRGDLLRRSATYYRKVLNIRLTDDPAWPELRDLEFLRHCIVHKGGVIGTDKESRSRLAGLQARFSSALTLFEGLGQSDAEIDLKAEVCAHYIHQTIEFFDRTMKRAGLLAPDSA
jgi:hypothetical protein